MSYFEHSRICLNISTTIALTYITTLNGFDCGNEF